MSETFNNGSKDGIDVNYHQYNVNMAFHNQSMMSPQNNVNMDYSINQQQQVQYPATLQAGASDVLKNAGGDGTFMNMSTVDHSFANASTSHNMNVNSNSPTKSILSNMYNSLASPPTQYIKATGDQFPVDFQLQDSKEVKGKRKATAMYGSPTDHRAPNHLQPSINSISPNTRRKLMPLHPVLRNDKAGISMIQQQQQQQQRKSSTNTLGSTNNTPLNTAVLTSNLAPTMSEQRNLVSPTPMGYGPSQIFPQYQAVFGHPAPVNPSQIPKVNFTGGSPRSNVNKLNAVSTSATGEALNNNSTTSFSSGRFDSSLGLLTKRFLSVIETLASPNHGLFDLSRAAELLQVQKRRIYDITNVLEGIGLIEKKGKNFIQWKRLVGDDKFENLDKVKGDLRELQAKVDKNAHTERAIDDHIDRMRQYLDTLSSDQLNQEHLYVTQGDLLSLKRGNQFDSFHDGHATSSVGTMIAVRAPQGTTLEVPDPSSMSPAHLMSSISQAKYNRQRNRYQIILKSRSGAIDVFLVNEKDRALKDKEDSKKVRESELASERAFNKVDESILKLAPPEAEPDYLFLHVPTNAAAFNIDCDDSTALYPQSNAVGIADLFDKSIQEGKKDFMNCEM